MQEIYFRKLSLQNFLLLLIFPSVNIFVPYTVGNIRRGTRLLTLVFHVHVRPRKYNLSCGKRRQDVLPAPLFAIFRTGGLLSLPECEIRAGKLLVDPGHLQEELVGGGHHHHYIKARRHHQSR